MLNEVELTTAKKAAAAAAASLDGGSVVAWEVDGTSFKVIDPIRFASMYYHDI